jgi:hypothetical protein
MRRTIRWPGRRPACCAPSARRRTVERLRPGLYFYLFFVSCALLAHFSPAARAAFGDSLTELGLHADSGFGQMQGPFTGNVNLNDLLGADRFHNAGYTGGNSVMANIEAGYIWNGHETLSHVQLIPTGGSALGEFDRHATWVSLILGGREGGTNPGSYQHGLARDAQFFSGAIATSWPTSSSFPRYTASFFANYSSL